MTQTIFPAVRYRDADAALTFLRRAFGATEKAIYRDEAGVIRHGEVLIAGAIVMIGTADDDGWLGGQSPEPRASTISLYLVVPDPDAHHETAVAAGAEVVRELQSTDYGSREYSVRDLEGNPWSFGTYDPNAAT